MKISTEINSARKLIGEEKAVELYGKAGFDAWDFSMFNMFTFAWNTHKAIVNETPLNTPDYLKFARKLKQIGLDYGITCNQAHAPFPVRIPEILDAQKYALECAAEAGAKICVVHPDNFKSPEENAEMFFDLLPFAKEYGVKIATENMWNWNDEKDEAAPAACSDPASFNAHLDAVNDDFLVACLDIGHAEMRGLNTNAVEMIKALGPRLQALHIHDNDLWHDSHQIPMSMGIDFAAVVKALKEIDYKGYFTLESDRYLHECTPDNIFEAIKEMAAVDKKLVEMFKNA